MAVMAGEGAPSSVEPIVGVPARTPRITSDMHRLRINPASLPNPTDLIAPCIRPLTQTSSVMPRSCGCTNVNKTHHSGDAPQYRHAQLAAAYPNFPTENPRNPVEVRLLNVITHVREVSALQLLVLTPNRKQDGR